MGDHISHHNFTKVVPVLYILTSHSFVVFLCSLNTAFHPDPFLGLCYSEESYIFFFGSRRRTIKKNYSTVTFREILRTNGLDSNAYLMPDWSYTIFLIFQNIWLFMLSTSKGCPSRISWLSYL